MPPSEAQRKKKNQKAKAKNAPTGVGQSTSADEEAEQKAAAKLVGRLKSVVNAKVRKKKEAKIGKRIEITN